MLLLLLLLLLLYFQCYCCISNDRYEAFGQVVNRELFQPRYPNQSGGGGGTNPYPSFGPNGGLSYPRGSSGGAGGGGGGGQFANNQVANPSSFPGNGQYPTLPQQPSQFPNNNNNNNNNSSQFQGQGGSSQYPRGPGGFPGGQFPAGAGQVSSLFFSPSFHEEQALIYLICPMS